MDKLSVKCRSYADDQVILASSGCDLHEMLVYAKLPSHSTDLNEMLHVICDLVCDLDVLERKDSLYSDRVLVPILIFGSESMAEENKKEEEIAVKMQCLRTSVECL
ncbi:hypothetical protein EVAR_76756_1 [Eumeta japonica]|uniref:Reverse transcriptase domain-containing protein n=1 Tax=Eumeta variegata TaxID=151549 RepID=A0A4C1ST19_EUMVA|nr:hypothetical protein EVAR_76756_1 [Eumeta japonica]